LDESSPAEIAAPAVTHGLWLKRVEWEVRYGYSEDSSLPRFDALLLKNSPFDVLNCSAFLVDRWKTVTVFDVRSAKASISLAPKGP
jgi:hypothetical protein